EGLVPRDRPRRRARLLHEDARLRRDRLRLRRPRLGAGARPDEDRADRGRSRLGRRRVDRRRGRPRGGRAAARGRPRGGNGARAPRRDAPLRRLRPGRQQAPAPARTLSGRIAAVLGRQPVRVTPVAGGYTQARRVVAELADGSRAFVKFAVDELTAGWLRAEHRVYSSVRASFLPDLLGWDDDGERPALALEDLSGAHWPPPWPEGSVDAGLVGHGWNVVQEDPEPFLSLGLVSEAWIERALPALLEAGADAPLDGDSFLHLDVRSDNVCLRGDRALLVDWNQACLGNPDVDVAAWAPSLRMEGGPDPWRLLPGAGELAAWISGFFAARAGLPPPPTADPSVRALQRAQLEVALPWAARELELPPQ